jgi:pseudouridine synthase
VVPIGRLDKASRGLLLLTPHARVCGLLLRPADAEQGSNVTKEYHVLSSRRVSDAELARLSAGMEIAVPNRDRSPRLAAATYGMTRVVTTRPCVVERLGDPRGLDGSNANALRFVLREGKHRQIRKMLGSLGNGAVDLLRVRFGTVGLGALTEGGVELLSEDKVRALLELARP